MKTLATARPHSFFAWMIGQNITYPPVHPRKNTMGFLPKHELATCKGTSREVFTVSMTTNDLEGTDTVHVTIPRRGIVSKTLSTTKAPAKVRFTDAQAMRDRHSPNVCAAFSFGSAFHTYNPAAG